MKAKTHVYTLFITIHCGEHGSISATWKLMDDCHCMDTETGHTITLTREAKDTLVRRAGIADKQLIGELLISMAINDAAFRHHFGPVSTETIDCGYGRYVVRFIA